MISNVLQMMVYQNTHSLKSVVIFYTNKIYFAIQTGEVSMEALILNHNKRWAVILNSRTPESQNVYH